MEPFDTDKFDALIRQKMSEPIDVHTKEIEQSRPFVWTAIQQKKPLIAWWHLAAAVVLILISTGGTFIVQQRSHTREIQSLAQQVAELKHSYKQQELQLTSKQQEVQALGQELAQMETTIRDASDFTPPPPTIIYKTDTVYLKQVEYITRLIEPETPAESEVILTSNDPPEEPYTDIIYPSVRSRSSSDETGMKVRFGSITTQQN